MPKPAYGYPKEAVLKTAMRVIGDFLFDHEMLVYIVVYDKTSYAISGKLFADVTSYIDDTYVNAEVRLSALLREYKAPSERRMKSANHGSIPQTADEIKLCSLFFVIFCDSTSAVIPASDW